MPDYKQLYFELFRATEKAIRILIDAQRNAETCILQEDTSTAMRCLPDEAEITEPLSGVRRVVAPYEQQK